MSNSSIWSIHKTLSVATTPGQSGLRSDDNKNIFHIPQSSSIIEALPSDFLVSYPEHSLDGYPSAEMQSLYSTVQADWAVLMRKKLNTFEKLSAKCGEQ